jgi:hypothetical protein
MATSSVMADFLRVGIPVRPRHQQGETHGSLAARLRISASSSGVAAVRFATIRICRSVESSAGDLHPLRGEVGRDRLAGPGRERSIAPPLAVHDAEQAAHLGQRLAAGLLDDEQRLAADPVVAVEQQPRGPALDGHHAHAVGDHVVQIAGDPGALRRHGGARPFLAVALEPVGTLLQLGGALRSRAARRRPAKVRAR